LRRIPERIVGVIIRIKPVASILATRTSLKSRYTPLIEKLGMMRTEPHEIFTLKGAYEAVHAPAEPDGPVIFFEAQRRTSVIHPLLEI
jgi:hypothetical protein